MDAFNAFLAANIRTAQKLCFLLYTGVANTGASAPIHQGGTRVRVGQTFLFRISCSIQNKYYECYGG